MSQSQYANTDTEAEKVYLKQLQENQSSAQTGHEREEQDCESDEELNPNGIQSKLQNQQEEKSAPSSIHRLSNNSSQSQPSNYSDMLEKNTRLIFKYPDGSCSYAYKCQKSGANLDEKRDSWLQVKGRHPSSYTWGNAAQGEDLSTFQVIQIEDELSFLMDNMEYLVEPDQAIKNYFEVRRYMLYILILNMVFEAIMTMYIVKNEMLILNHLKRIYKFWRVKDYQNFFEVLTGANVSFNILMYLYGFYAVHSHKATNYQIYSVVLMISIFSGILMTYLNIFNLLLFLLKCFTYVFTRHTLTELYTVLIIPSDLHSLILNNGQADDDTEESGQNNNIEPRGTNNNLLAIDSSEDSSEHLQRINTGHDRRRRTVPRYNHQNNYPQVFRV